MLKTKGGVTVVTDANGKCPRCHHGVGWIHDAFMCYPKRSARKSKAGQVNQSPPGGEGRTARRKHRAQRPAGAGRKTPGGESERITCYGGCMADTLYNACVKAERERDEAVSRVKHQFVVSVMKERDAAMVALRTLCDVATHFHQFSAPGKHRLGKCYLQNAIVEARRVNRKWVPAL